MMTLLPLLHHANMATPGLCPCRRRAPMSRADGPKEAGTRTSIMDHGKRCS